MSRHTVHSYLRSIKCLASWLVGGGYLGVNPFLAVNPYCKKKGVMPVLKADDRIPKVGRPADVAMHGRPSRLSMSARNCWKAVVRAASGGV